MRHLVLLVLAFASCMSTAGPRLPEPTHRQQKLFQARPDEVWKAARAAVEEAHLPIAADDEAQGTLRVWMRKSARSRPEELERELARIANVEKARERGLGRLAEYLVEYTVEVHPVGDDRTGLDVSTEITAVHHEAIVVPPGIVHIVPRNFPVPSRGVLERQLVEQIGARLLLSEEMLYSLGVLGRD